MTEADLDDMTPEETQAYNIALVKAELAAAPIAAMQHHHLFQTEQQILIALVDARQRRRMTQAELASAVGCTRTTISRIECGAAQPNIKLLLGIADALGLGVALLAKPGPEKQTG